MIFGISILGVVFLSTLSLRRATPAWLPYFPMEQRFLSTLSLRRATSKTTAMGRAIRISIHALLAESDAFLFGGAQRSGLFLSTLSLRRATDYFKRYGSNSEISIHALLAESDQNQKAKDEEGQYFYPRSPCGERRNSPVVVPRTGHFYPRSPCGERQGKPAQCTATEISIHALLAESDLIIMLYETSSLIFLSTLSLRRATHYDNYNLHCVEISIHALLAESDNRPKRED